MKAPTYVLSVPLIGALTAALLAGCAGDPDRDGCDISALGTAGDSISLAAAVAPSRLVAGSLTAGADGTYVVASCTDGTCRWNAGGGAYEPISETGYGAISPDLTLVARKVGCSDIALVEVDRDEEVQRLEGLPNPKVTDASPVGEIAFSPDGELVAGAGLEGDLIVWSVEDGEEVASADLGNGIGSISFSPDGTLVAVASGDRVSILEADSGDEVDTLAAARGADPAWSPDGRWIAGVTTEGYPTVWDAKTFEAVESLPGQPATAVAFSPDSRSLAVTADPGDVRLMLWAPAALGGSGGAREVAQAPAMTSNVIFSPDGKTLYTASAREGLAAWDVATGRPAGKFDQPPMPE
ncbi:PQQ-binding-like beta-propeller repeat protein [Nocardioides sp. NBC_00368]|uniref:WD40 repeat domain-containing protein n=1 Tax=Nocardioides sp. NBC_00368 TaxID=2976000 RepID=UPI002E1ECD01